MERQVMPEQNYKDTINLPKTSFSMKANLPQTEPAIRRRWDEIGLYARIRRARAGREKFILHDGPPYPTGEMHVGLAMNKVLKDIVIRHRTMCGFDAPYCPGWDCHGLPIEFKVLQEAAGEQLAKMEIRRRCKKYAEKFVKKHKEQFIALGVSGEWENPYLTFLPEYEAGVVSVFAQMVEKGYACRAKKPVHWCFACETVLAEAELEYDEKTSPSIYVNFPVVVRASGAFADVSDLCIMIWTTTPWTIPANLAVAVNKGFDYAAVRYERGGKETTSIMAAQVVPEVMRAIGAASHRVVATVKGAALIGLQYVHPFIERTSPVIAADFVSLQDGTGCVHVAPGHGMEDYQTGLASGLEILSPVDSKGRFTGGFPLMEGVQVYEANDRLCDLMAGSGALVAKGKVVHSYPHCWRCHTPVIFRATDQWFIKVDHQDLRARLLDEIRRVRWVPSWGEKRINAMVADRPDWCISRQKSWGIPIPVFYCSDCGGMLITRESVEAVGELFAVRGSNAWFEMEADEILKGRFACASCGSKRFRKEQDIFDVWFESGTSFRAVVQRSGHLRFPADLYLEGTDQHRGWFQLSLLPSVAVEGVAPYRTVVTNGFVVDRHGRKMSKSKGNFISAENVLAAVGADVFRLWVSSIDYKDHIHVDMADIEETATAYRRIRNTIRYLLGSLGDFDPRTDAVAPNDCLEIDRWAIARSNEMVRRLARYYDEYDFHKAYQLVQNFCSVEMSAFYLDVLKDRMYTFPRNSQARRSAQTAQWIILGALAKVIAPVLAHTADEVWQTMAKQGLLACDEPGESVHLAAFPIATELDCSGELVTKMGRLLAVREDVLRRIETLRADKTIGNSLEAAVTLSSDDVELLAFLRQEAAQLPAYFIVSQVTVLDAADGTFAAGQAVPSLRIRVARCSHRRCARCWNCRESVGADSRHPRLCDRCVEAISLST